MGRARSMHKLQRVDCYVHISMMFWPEVKNDNLIGEPVKYYLADFFPPKSLAGLGVIEFLDQKYLFILAELGGPPPPPFAENILATLP